ncbi:MAG: hypothetical protein K6E20_04820 [Acholeplasmatales bacterium]|nr:hypothetical protein [Acholeplasmatales bacterium]
MRKKSIKCLIFLSLLFCAYILSLLLIPSVDAKEKRVLGYKRSDNKNLDIVCVGNSDLYSGYVPSIIYEKYGYLSYNCGKSQVSLNQVYDYTKNIFEYQKPELLILEVDCLTFKGKKKPNKAYSNVYHNHDFWKQKYPKDIIELKGYVFSDKIVPPLDEKNDKDVKKHDIKIKKEKFDIVKNIKKLCDENNTKLMLLELPSYTSWTKKLHDQIESFSNEENIDFLDLNFSDEFVNEYGYDPNHDFRDGGNHLNVYGATKATNLIGNYIQKYNITPNEGNESFEKAVELFNEKMSKIS